jgi:sulfur-carrier protein adenylyltransferase/sulfurtransferase
MDFLNARNHLMIDLHTEGTELSSEEMLRYSRHVSLSEVGVEGQKRLKASSILLVGAGGLGSPLAMYLAAAGIGRLGLVDFDKVDASNLHRQLIHGTKDVGRLKIESARESIADINPNVQVDCYETALRSANALEIMEGYDLVIDGTDNFPTRYLVNDACVLLGIPNVYGSIFRFEGQSSVFGTPDGPCYRCLFPQPPPPGAVPNCAEGGVIGVLPGIVGLIQANEAIKLLLGVGEPLIGRLLLFDALAMKFREIKLKRDPKCPVCGDHPTVTELIDYKEFCGFHAEDEGDNPLEITAVEVKARMDNGDDFVLIDCREAHEYAMCKIEGAVLIPLSEYEAGVGAIDKSADIVVHCKMGGRSAQVQAWMLQNGYENVLNMTGGITAWSHDVDSSVPVY